MARRYPGAVWDPLGAQTESRMTSHDIVCVHTMVGTLAGTDSMFEGDGYGGTESHFGTGGAGEQPRQWQDLAYTADANLDGNDRVISIENADMGPGFPAWSGEDVPGFTDTQADDLVALIGWLCSPQAHADCPSSWRCHQEGIPAKLIPDTLPGRRGIAYHRQGIDGNYPDHDGRKPGGERWSTLTGKLCPGYKRSAQLIDIIIPRIQAGGAPLEDDMPSLDEIRQMVVNPRAKKTDQLELGEALRMAANASARSEKVLRGMSGMADEIAAAAAAQIRTELPDGGGTVVSEKRLREIVFTQATRALNTRLGSLDDG